MILFMEDWDRYPNAIIDINTRSVSALKMASVYKKMGINNHAFHLQLMNPELSGIDLYKETSDEIKFLVSEELQVNPWYYFREIAMAPASGGLTPDMFRLNRANIALYWSFFNHMTSILIQCRQTGKTLSLDHLKILLLMYFSVNSSLGLFTKNSGLRSKNIESIKDLMDSLPRWLDFRDKTDSNNTEEITVNAMGNKLTTAVAQATKAAAMNIFRGETKPVIDIDEAAFIVNLDLSLAGMLPAMTAAADNAERSGLPHGINFATTAGYLDIPSCQYFHKNIYSKAARFSESMFDLKNREELKRVVEVNGVGKRNTKILIEMNHRDLGFTDDWLSQKIADSMVTKSQAEAEFLLIWNKGSTKSALSAKVIKRLDKNKKEPTFTKIYDSGFILNWYITEEQSNNMGNTHLIIGIDSSDAIGEDSISFIVRDYKSGIVIAAGKYDNANLDDFGDFVFEFMSLYINSTLIIETRSSAFGILDQLSKLLHASGENVFKRVFNWIVSEPMENKDKLEEVKNCPQKYLNTLYIKYKKYFGYSTSGGGKSSRGNLYGRDFEMYVSSVAEYIYDRDLIGQLTALVEKNGRIDHVYKKHDDMVIGFLLISWMLYRAANLDFYGINSSLVLSKVLNIEDDKEETENRKREIVNSNIIEEISVLIEELTNVTNESEALLIQTRIKLLKSKIGDITISKNIDNKLQEAINNLNRKTVKRKPIDLSKLY